MALAIDSEMPTNTGASNSSLQTLTYSFTNTAGTLLVVGVSFGSAAALTVSTVTYAGAAMTAVTGATVGYDGASHNFAGVALYFKLNPATGANNVVVTMSAANASQGIESGAISFTGNDTSTPIVASSGKTNFRESSGTTATVASGTTTTGNIVVACMATGTAYGSTSQTLSWSKNENTASAGGAGAMTRTAGTGGTITMTDNITSDFMGMVCCEIAAASGGGGSTWGPLLGLQNNRLVGA